MNSGKAMRPLKCVWDFVAALRISLNGMEFPDNVEIALAMEGAIHGDGTHPATISIIRGRITVGLTAEQIEAFGTAEGIAKCSRRDLPGCGWHDDRDR